MVAPLTACPTLRLPRPVAATSMVAPVAVLKFAAVLSPDAACVFVSFNRCVKLYDVPAVSSLNVGLSCHAPFPLRYSALFTVVSVMLVEVALAIVGAAGVFCAAFSTVAVADDVTLPVKLPAVTTTVMV